MAGKIKLFYGKNGVYVKMLVGLSQAVIFAMILLPFVESHVNHFFEIHKDFRFVGHVIETSISDGFECGMRCSRNIKCRSYNLHPRGYLGNKTCEMNDQTRQLKPKDLRPIKGFIYYEKSKRGWYPHQPGHSCKDILDSGHSRGDGEYWIDPENNGNPLLVYCDMTTDGGGWLLIYNIVIDGSSPPTTLGVETSYRGISHYNNNNMLLATSGLNELRSHLSFSQLRFHCRKQQLGRTFHVTTATNSAGEAVVQYFSRQTDDIPYACGSFEILTEDNSKTANDCTEWGGGKDDVFHVGKWGHEGMRELYKFPAFIYYEYNWATNPEQGWDRWECDDFGNSATVSSGDFWKIYVR